MKQRPLIIDIAIAIAILFSIWQFYGFMYGIFGALAQS